MGISRHLTIWIDYDSGVYEYDASCINLSVTQLTFSMTLILFVFRQLCRSQRDLAVSHVSFLLFYVLPVNCPGAQHAVIPFSAFFVLSILYFLKFKLPLVDICNRFKTVHFCIAVHLRIYFFPTTTKHVFLDNPDTANNFYQVPKVLNALKKYSFFKSWSLITTYFHQSRTRKS